MLEQVVRLLQDHPFARVKFPDEEKMRRFADMVQLQEPAVSDIIGFMDDVLFAVECTDKHIKQNVFYCGYNCDKTINNIFAYGPDGKVFFCAINFPGSWVDGSLAECCLHKLKSKNGLYKICIDQGLFPRGGDVYGLFVGPITKRTARRLHCNVWDYYLWISNIHMLLHQASKWGMRGLQGTIPRCKTHLPSDCEHRLLVLEAIVLIHNFCTEYVGCSQIKTVFDPEYARVKNLVGYDCIAQYYFQLGDYNSEEDGNEEDGNEEEDRKDGDMS
jgi:hypothetical protein